MTPRVAIAGIGMTRFTRGDERSLSAMGAAAAADALAGSGLQGRGRDAVDAIFTANLYGGAVLGQRIARELALTGLPILNVENACASGATALNEAVWSVRSGRYRRVLVVGAEKLSALPRGPLPLDRLDPEVAHGLTMPALYAMRAVRYLHDSGASEHDLAQVAVINRRNGLRNERAYLRTPVTADEVLSSRPIATPLTLLQCCPNTDGAAAVVVAEASEAQSLHQQPVEIASSVVVSGKFTNGFRDMTELEISRRAVASAYHEADVSPADVDVVELHNAFTIADLLYYEVLGFADRGKGYALLPEFDAPTARPAINTGGGLLARGHPVGATGVAQIVELAEQLRGEAGERQARGARVALAHVTGGGTWGFDNAACGVHILKAA